MVKTSFGEVPLSGRIEPAKPLLFVIRGAFPARDHLTDLATHLSHLSVGLVDLPGMHSPFFDEQSPQAFGAAFDEIVERFAAPTVVVGESMGGVAAMAMNSRHIIGRVLLDTPLQTEPIWPLRLAMWKHPPATEAMARWVTDIFGITGDRIVNRDFRHMPRPGDTVIVGSEPLGKPRKVPRTPSAVSEHDREVYRRAGARVIVAPGTGHEIAVDARNLVLASVADAFSSGC